MVKFLRRDWKRYSKLGRRRKKKQVWRRPTGRDNKMRERRKGYPVRVSIGYKQQIDNKNKIIKVNNLNELMDVQKGETVILGKMGKKKKIEIAKQAKEKGIKISNLNVKELLGEIEKKKVKKKAEEDKVREKKKEEGKKAKEKKKEESKSAPKGVPPHHVPGTRTSNEVSSGEGKEKPKEAGK